MQCLSNIRSVFGNMSYCIALVPKDVLYCNHEHYFAHKRCDNSKMYYHIQALKYKATQTEHMVVVVTSNCLFHSSTTPLQTQNKLFCKI